MGAPDCGAVGTSQVTKRGGGHLRPASGRPLHRLSAVCLPVAFATGEDPDCGITGIGPPAARIFLVQQLAGDRHVQVAIRRVAFDGEGGGGGDGVDPAAEGGAG